ncbi:MAG: DUF2336 domain-containing protein [Alphaproteobacteria bacterium]|nr:DUF2336 domain-containing protein [Alphaproteobacteria bacterium]
MTEQFHLTPADVQRLLNDPSSTTRADTAAKVAREFSHPLSDAERKLAEDIIRAMMRDVEVKVRQMLAENLKDNPAVPRDVAKAMAKDVESVALPILTYSSVLSEDDLLEVVRTNDTAKQLAVARRPMVSEKVSDALADTGKTEVVATLMANDGAQISEKTFVKVIERHGNDETVGAAIVHRRTLPVAVSERLVAKVSQRLRDELVTRHQLPESMATDLILQARERATISLLSADADRFTIDALVDQLHANKRLTPTIVVRALCMGDILFFESAIARLTNVSPGNVYLLLNDMSGRGINSLLERSAIPRRFHDVIRAALEVARETSYDGGPNDRERFRQRVITRVLTQFEGGFDTDNLDYLIHKLAAA